MHAARGIAVLDLLPARTPDAVDALRARLDAARFPAIFAGHLPVVHLHATPREMAFLPALLDEAFARQPPLCLPGGDAWVAVAKRVLTAEQPASGLLSRRGRSAAAAVRPRRSRAGVAILRRVGAVLLCCSALGGVLAMVLGEAPAPPPVAATPLPAPVVAVAPPMTAGEAGPLGGARSIPVPAPEPAPTPPAIPAQTEAEAVVPQPPEAPSVALTLPPAENPPAKPSQRAAPPRRSDAGTPPNRKPPERTASRRQQDAGAASSSEGAAPTSEPAPDRCRRVSALVGSGTALGEADMRFFNESCIRW